MDADGPIIIGVRHHSPACAHLVRRTIEARRPAFVLIEGPADFNPHIDDLKHAHTLPLAIFSTHADATTTRASYSPFCRYSPEWQALQAAWETGATPLFCDLPSWHPDFGDRDNRYADPHELDRHVKTTAAALEHALGAEGSDAVWDTLVEQRRTDELGPLLSTYFDGLRPEDIDDPREAGRETFMGRYAAWALREARGRPVVLVCGGWHVRGIRSAIGRADGALPPTPSPAEGIRAASYMTPFSYHRLDSFTGYASGMPSPAYYEEVYDHGLDAAADWAMDRIVLRLRQAGLPISTADRIAWRANASALASLRCHRSMLRSDILDAALVSLVKDALSEPAAWTRSGTIRRSADDIVVAMLQALSGETEGRLAPGTRQPPLIADIEQRLEALQLQPEPKAKRVAIDWRNPADRPRAKILHQLRLLALPGVTHSRGPTAADARDLSEVFDIVKHPHWTGAIIEASRWGAELPSAAAARLRSSIADAAGDAGVLAKALSDGLFAGLFGLGRDLAADLARSVARSSDFGALGKAGLTLTRLTRYGDAFGVSVAQDLAPICRSVFERAIRLCEEVAGNDEAIRAVDAVLAMRDFARDCAGLALDLASAKSAFERLLADPATPAALSGAALGYLVALGQEDPASDAVRTRVRGFGTPGKLGDFLAGLFALAREAVGGSVKTLAAVDELLADWTDADFLAALPSLRGAFSWFPPREREALARRILQQAGFNAAEADAASVAWMRQRTPLADQTTALALEARTAAKLMRYGF